MKASKIEIRQVDGEEGSFIEISLEKWTFVPIEYFLSGQMMNQRRRM